MDRSISASIAVTPGDPAGIGPNVLAQAWQILNYDKRVRFCGGAEVWRRAAGQIGLDPAQIEAQCIEDQLQSPVVLPKPGFPDRAGALLAWRAVDRVLAGVGSEFSAIVTGPISKAQMDKVGFPHLGHTEYLQERLAAHDVLMVMYAQGFCVGLATVHIPLANVPSAISKNRISTACRLLASFLQKIGIDGPRIAVAGLNPHAGEDGLLGDEEAVIQSAIAGAEVGRAQLFGPLPGDTVFHAMAEGRYDAVLAMFHDQGLAPFKLKHFHDGVNVTVGLPVLRTSPDHGTAFELAKSGVLPDAGSAVAALKLALR